MSPLDVLYFSDDRPGHYHLTEGILAALGRRRTLAVTRIAVRRPRWLTPGLLWRLTESGLSPGLLLGYAYGLDASSLPKARLVVSAGGDTLAANVSAARLLKADNIFYGSLRRYAPERFSLVLTSYAAKAGRPRHAMTLKPNSLDPGTLNKPDAANGPLGLLVGGDAGTVRFSAADWSQLLDFIPHMATTSGRRWIVSNSRRTPAAVSDRLAALAAADNSPIASFVDVRSSGPGTLGELLGRSYAVLCTADSSSMVSEAVWAQRRVVAIAPQAMMLPADETAYRDYLEHNRWTASLAIAELSPHRLNAALAPLQPLRENPLDSLADLIAERLPQLFA